MRTRAEWLMTEINRNQKRLFEIEDEKEKLEKERLSILEDIMVARANLREETK